MSAMNENSLPGWLAGLPKDKRDEYAAVLHTFAHDLRQPLAQIHSAEELLRRGLAAGKEEADLLELLDIIKEANRRSAELVADFIDGFLEGVEPPDLSDL